MTTNNIFIEAEKAVEAFEHAYMDLLNVWEGLGYEIQSAKQAGAYQTAIHGEKIEAEISQLVERLRPAIFPGMKDVQPF